MVKLKLEMVKEEKFVIYQPLNGTFGAWHASQIHTYWTTELNSPNLSF